jgi:hypothetical protein
MPGLSLCPCNMAEIVPVATSVCPANCRWRGSRQARLNSFMIAATIRIAFLRQGGGSSAVVSASARIKCIRIVQPALYSGLSTRRWTIFRFCCKPWVWTSNWPAMKPSVLTS